MILQSAKISGYKSFRQPVEVFCSQRTTVLIGPNDHGKTNILLAVEKLSPDRDFDAEEVNDRLPDKTAACITFRLQLSDSDVNGLASAIKPFLEQEALN